MITVTHGPEQDQQPLLQLIAEDAAYVALTPNPLPDVFARERDPEEAPHAR